MSGVSYRIMHHIGVSEDGTVCFHTVRRKRRDRPFGASCRTRDLADEIAIDQGAW